MLFELLQSGKVHYESPVAPRLHDFRRRYLVIMLLFVYRTCYTASVQSVVAETSL